jgi:hypothetical protein
MYKIMVIHGFKPIRIVFTNFLSLDIEVMRLKTEYNISKMYKE